MAAPTIRSTGTETSTSGQSISCPLPGDYQDGDVLLVSVYVGAAQVTASVQEAGWTEVDHVYFASIDGTAAAFWKHTNGSETGINVVIDGGTNRTIAVQCSSIAGADTTNPIDVTPVLDSDLSATSYDPSSITTVTDGCLIFSLVGAIGSGITTPSVPSGYTSLHEEKLSNHYLGTAYISQSTKGAENPGSWGSWTITASHGGMVFAVKSPTSAATNIVKSVEFLEIDWDAASEPVTTNLTKGQDYSQCVPFFTKQLVSGSLTDDFRERTMKVDLINNGGTPAVRVDATGKISVNDHRLKVFIVEFESQITVQQVDADISNGNSSANISITDVSDQTTAFMLYSYLFNHTSAVDTQDNGCIKAAWNGAATDSITISRSGTVGSIDGKLYVVSCSSSEFSVQHADITLAAASTLTNTSITSVVMAKTFIIPHWSSPVTDDDPRDWGAAIDLSSSTNIRTRRCISASPSAALSIAVQVVECAQTEWSVQRADFTTTSTLTEDETISTIDTARTIVKTGTHYAGLNAFGTSDQTNGNLIDEIGAAASIPNVTTVRFIRESNIETGNTIPYEVIQFEAGISQNILVPTGPLR